MRLHIGDLRVKYGESYAARLIGTWDSTSLFMLVMRLANSSAPILSGVDHTPKAIPYHQLTFTHGSLYKERRILLL